MSSTLSCFWSLSLNGATLDMERRKCIKTLDISGQCDGSNTLTITVSDPNMIFINDNIFIEEAEVYLYYGWYGSTYTEEFTGHIATIDIDFPEDGCPTLSIFCLDRSHVMNREKKTRSWDKITRAQAVQIVAREYGFKCVIQAGYTFSVEDTISQSNSTDLEFVESLASEEREPFLAKLIGDTLYYTKKGLINDPSCTVYYKQFPYDVISFSPQINKETRQVSKTSSDVDTSSKTTDSYTATDSNTSRDVQGDSGKSYVYDPGTRKWVSK